MIARGLKRSVPYIILIVITLPIIIFYGWLFMSSFATRTHGLKPLGLTLSNWRFILGWKSPWRRDYPSVWEATLNTFIFAAIVTLAEVSVSAATGYALSRLKFPGRKGFLGLTLVLHAFPSVTLLIAIFFILRALRLYDTMPGVIMVKVALDLPFGIWIMKGFFDTVSWDIEMSALIDGCSRIRTWIQIVLPLIRPGIAALSIFCFLSGWSEFLLPYIFTTRFDNWTLSVLLRNLIGDFRFVDYGLVTAVGLFYMVPVLIFYAFTQQYLLSIYTGGVKGGA
jgi:inositol-phosphate transport system permease protein